MLEASQPWSLFGYDIRRGFYYFRAGWHDFLWGDGSPVLGATDEVVQAYQESGERQFFRSGERVEEPRDLGEVIAQAVILPEHLVLSKTLRVPAVAEAELVAVVALEVSASSPFPEDDTCYGWRVAARSKHDLDVQLVISSRSAVMAFIGAQLETHDIHAYEVWAQEEGRAVMLQGFGETARLQRNRRRLVRMGSVVAYCLAVLMLLFALAAGGKYLELQRVQAFQVDVERSAEDALALRTGLAGSKVLIGEINTMLARSPSAYRELKRLTSILGPDTWLQSADIRGSKVKIEGESTDASAVMQQLLENRAYSKVEALVAFKKVRSGLERFVLVLTLATQESGE